MEERPFISIRRVETSFEPKRNAADLLAVTYRRLTEGQQPAAPQLDDVQHSVDRFTLGPFVNEVLS